MSLVTIPYRYAVRGGTAANLASVNEVLLPREVCIETDTGGEKVGDGVTAWNALPYRVNPFFAVATGTNTLTATYVSKPVLVDGLELRVRAAAANTGAATFNPNSLGALSITKQGGSALLSGDIAAAGHELVLRYRASPARYELLNPAGATVDIGGLTHAATSKTTPVDADELPLADSAASFSLVKLTLANLKAFLFGSPALTGIPTAPTASASTSTTQIATTAMVQSAIAAGPSGSGAWTMVKKTADEARNNTITSWSAAVDSSLQMALAASTRYRIRIDVMYNQANATMDFQYMLVYTGTITSQVLYRMTHPPEAGIGTDNDFTAINTTIVGNGSGLAISVTTTSAGYGYLRLELILVTNAAGTFQFRWMQNTNDAANLTLLAGSYIEYMAV